MMMMEEPLEGNFLGLDLAQVVGVVPNDNAGYNFGVGLVFSEAIAFEVSPVIPNGEGEQEAVAMNQLDSAQSDNRRDRKTIQDALDAEILATDANFLSSKEDRDVIAGELDAQEAKQESEKVAADSDRGLIRTEMAANETDRDNEIATAKAAADAAIVTAKAAADAAIVTAKELLDSEQAAQDARLDVLEGDENVEGSIDNHIKNVIDGSPAALNTLNELAEALGDDADFASTITELVAQHKLDDASARSTMKSELDAKDTEIENALAAEIAATDADFNSAKEARDVIAGELDAQESKQESEKVAADSDRGLIRTEMAANETDRDNEIATAKAAADAAIVTAKGLLDAEQAAQDAATAKVASDLSSYEESNNNALAAEIAATDADFSGATEDRAAIRTEMATNESDRDSSIESAKVAADAAIVTAKELLDSEQAAQDAATAKVASDLASYEGSNDAALDAQKLKQAGDKSDADSDRGLIRTEMAANETDRDNEIATAKAAADAAIVTAKGLLDTEQAAQDARLDVIEGNDSVEGSIDWHIAQVIDAAPAALDTLNELAESLGDDANFAATVTNTIATHRSQLDAKDVEIENALAAEIAATDADFSGATEDRAAIRTEMATGFNSSKEARELIAEELDVQEDKQESEKVAADSDRSLIRTEMAANETDRDNEIATAKAAADAAIVTAKELLDVEQEEQNTAIAKVASDLSSYEESNDAALVELNENLSTQISEIENEGVQDADFTKQTVDVGGKAAGERAEMLIPGKITDSMVVTFVGGLFQHGANVSYDSEANATTVSVVLYSDQPAYSPMTVFGVKSFGTE